MSGKPVVIVDGGFGFFSWLLLFITCIHSCNTTSKLERIENKLNNEVKVCKND